MTTQKHALNHLIRGGQVTLHQIRMFVQIITRVFGYTFVGVLLLDALWLYLKTDPYAWSLLFDYGWAQLMLPFNPKATQAFYFYDGSVKTVLSSDIIHSPIIQTYLGALWQGCVLVVWMSVVGYVVFSVLLAGWLIRKGQSQMKETPKKVRLLPAKQLIARLKKDKVASDIKLGNVPIVKNTECRHFFIHGSTGTGKSQLFYQLLDQIRERGDRAIVYDKGCQFVKYFYRKNKDILLNPLDARSQSWHLWSECHETADYDRVAEAIIPQGKSYSDPFWINAARTVFASCAQMLQAQGELSHEKLLYYCLSAELTELHGFLKTTPAASMISPESEKMAGSVRSVIATAIKGLAYLSTASDQDLPAFSIRDWLGDGGTHDTDSTLFIASTTQHHAALTPLMSMWLDIAMHGLLSLSEDPTRRIWVLMDELPTLHRLPCLQSALAEGRKYGACIVLGLQSISQLISAYGQHDADAICSVTNTGVFFRSPLFKNAIWVSKALGEIDIERVNEGMSYGANTMRDGVSIQSHTQTKPIVMPEAIMGLHDLHGYLSLSHHYPITEMTQAYQAREARAPGYIADPNKRSWIDAIRKVSTPTPDKTGQVSSTAMDTIIQTLD